ncbi:MAG TPA: ABC transporter permease [Burkholderiaceae bacterium]|nr:ABC transporter permease [Burkholderiaceae bacterium]
MSLSGLSVQFLNGLADASSLFLVAVGLSLIFGVTRIVNFAHGSLYMLGVYLAVSLVGQFGADSVPGFWLAVLASASLVAVLGVVIEVLLLRRLYHAPELFQLLATFALVLIIGDLTLWWWGPEDLFGPLAPGLSGSVPVLGRYIPEYDFLLMALGPLVLLLLWLLLQRTHWGALLRAATQDRAMLGALGVNQAWLFTAVFALGAFLAGMGGALQVPRQPANLDMDLSVIAEAFVVVVVGGMGSIPGAYVAALLIAQIKALCIALGTVTLAGWQIDFPSLTLGAEFALMAVVLIFRPWGLFGRRPAQVHASHAPETPLAPAGRRFRIVAAMVVAVLLALPLMHHTFPYAPVLAFDALLAVLFALSLHFMMGPGGMYSFGHAAYFGLGAYGSALVVKHLGWSMAPAMAAGPLVALMAAIVFGWFCVRLSGVYLAMLTLAFAQIVWSVVYQWDSFTGGSNGIIGIWPADSLSGNHYYYFVLAIVLVVVWLLRRIVFSPFGQIMRASRDAPTRARALGIPVMRVQWLTFVLAGAVAGLAGALFVFAKGSTSPEVLSIERSVDGLVMVLLGGLNHLAGPLVGAGAFQLLDDVITGLTEYWHALLGAVILLLVLVFPGGLAGRHGPVRAAA